jgi:biotin carboxyl carrier protein
MQGVDVVVRSADREVRIAVEPLGDGRARVLLRAEGGAEHEARELLVEYRFAHGTISFLVDGRQYELATSEREREAGATRYWVHDGRRVEEVEVLEPLAYLARRETRQRGGGGTRRVAAYMPGRVVQLLVSEGTRVAAGQGVLVLEAMKMENEIAAEHAGVVARILVAPGQAVEGGDPLFELVAE